MPNDKGLKMVNPEQYRARMLAAAETIAESLVKLGQTKEIESKHSKKFVFKVESRSGQEYLSDPLCSLPTKDEGRFVVDSLEAFLAVVWQSGRFEIIPPRELLLEQRFEFPKDFHRFACDPDEQGCWTLFFHNDYD